MRIVKSVFRILLRLILIAAALAALAALTLAFLRWRGYILLPDEVHPPEWQVFGVDVSTYQGEVDWASLAGQGVDFAFIKATEGSGLKDVRFAENWAGAQAAGVRPGAYHFFSYDSPGETQAQNFIETVPVTPGSLPPVVDIEFTDPIWMSRPTPLPPRPFWTPSWTRWRSATASNPSSTPPTALISSTSPGGSTGTIPSGSAVPWWLPCSTTGISGSTATPPGWRAIRAGSSAST